MEQAKGLILINTGTGKGKTTAALGTAIRAWGDGQKVLILQFIKGAWKYGELKAIESLGKINGNIEIRPMGDGFVFHNKKISFVFCYKAIITAKEKKVVFFQAMKTAFIL